MSAEFAAALQAIAGGRTPCLECGAGHHYRYKTPGDPSSGTTWASPVDGHFFHRMSVEEYARAVLSVSKGPSDGR